MGVFIILAIGALIMAGIAGRNKTIMVSDFIGIVSIRGYLHQLTSGDTTQVTVQLI